jgi:SAM-dependent methyltransferase
MATNQQQETLDYFRKHAEAWKAKAQDSGNIKVNVIEQRNGYVLQIADERRVRSFLDVGCGTGELVHEIARRGVDATGVDYAPEMIKLASSAQHASTTVNFVCCSIFDLEMKDESYDLISANGFIEYISHTELRRFFQLVEKALAPGGSFIVGSRNRLFNLTSMNQFTLQETNGGGIDLLLKEAIKWATTDEFVKFTTDECAPLQPSDTKHETTGIHVATRFQYSPLQLINLLQEIGLQAIEVYPVHIHGVTPEFKKTNPDVHTSISNLLQTFARHNTQLLAQASSFMLHVKKEK